MYYRSKTRRVIFIDELRGLCILLMVAFHGAYNLVYIFGVDIPAFHVPLLQNFAQPFVAGIFVVISGIAGHYSKNNIKRGIIVLAFGLLITVVTVRIMPGQEILFGILHLLGLCMMLYGIFSHGRGAKPDRLSAFAGISLFSILFALTYHVPRGYLGFFGTPVYLSLPERLYSEYWLSPLGFLSKGFQTADYYPIIPWLFLFFAGSYLGRALREGGAPEFFYRSRFRVLSGIGRHTLIIYVLHQPVLYGSMLGVFKLIEMIENL